MYLGYLEEKAPGSVLFRNTGSGIPHIVLIPTAIGTGQVLVIEILRRPLPVLTMPITRTIRTNMVREEVQGTPPPQVLDTIILHTILPQGRSLTSCHFLGVDSLRLGQ